MTNEAVLTTEVPTSEINTMLFAELTFKYALLSEISSIALSLHQDNMYTREDAIGDLKKVIKMVHADLPVLPINSDVEISA